MLAAAPERRLPEQTHAAQNRTRTALEASAGAGENRNHRVPHRWGGSAGPVSFCKGVIGTDGGMFSEKSRAAAL